MECTECGAEVPAAPSHWLCYEHRKSSATALLDAVLGAGRSVSEAQIMRALVFNFPEKCGYKEFAARVRHVSDVWTSRSKIATLEDTYGVSIRGASGPTGPTGPTGLNGLTCLPSVGLTGLTGLTGLNGITKPEMRDLLCSFVEFVCRNDVARLNEACEDRVRAWYPALICAETTSSLLRGERMLYAVERVTGKRSFLVLADVAVALHRKLSRDTTELVYLWYARGIAEFEGIQLQLA